MDNNQEKAVVITGGSGFIGSNVAKLFVDSGFNVINIDRKKREIAGVTQYPFEIDNKQVKGIIELIKPLAVIHIAANNSVPQSVIDPMPTYTDNVLQTISLLNTCVGAGVQNFIYASSSSVYGSNECIPFKIEDNVDKRMLTESPALREQSLQQKALTCFLIKKS